MYAESYFVPLIDHESLFGFVALTFAARITQPEATIGPPQLFVPSPGHVRTNGPLPLEFCTLVARKVQSGASSSAKSGSVFAVHATVSPRVGVVLSQVT